MTTNYDHRITSEDELHRSIPHLLGFYPERSLVMIALDRAGAVAVTARVDAPMTYDQVPERVHALLPVALSSGCTRVLVIYADYFEIADTDDGPVAIERRAEALAAYEQVRFCESVISRLFEEHGIESRILWPPEPGEPPSRTGPIPPVALSALVAGRAALPSRSALRELIAPIDGVVRAEVREHIATFEALGLPDKQLIDAALPIIREFVAAQDEGRNTNCAQSQDIAICAVALRSIPARDVIIGSIATTHAWTALDLWLRIVRAVPRRYLAPTVTVLAICSYLDGNGALAAIAIDRALEVEPEYSLAHLIDESLRSGIHPAVMRELIGETLPGCSARVHL